MSDQALGVVVKEVNHKTHERKDGKGTYTTVEIVGEDGSKFSNFDNKVNHVPEAGDTVDIAFIPVKTPKGGTVRNILSVKASQASKPNEKRHTPAKHAENKSPFTAEKAEKTDSKAVSTSTSMEVSGLLQALLNAGAAELSPNELESLLRTVINIKRKVAQDLENTGRA